MGLWDTFIQNFVSPPILFFILGVFAGFLKSDLEVPESISRYLALYLMMSIGFKGGVAIAGAEDGDGKMVMAIAAGIAFGFVQPFIGYWLLRATTRLDVATAAAVAAHYGSISLVTFATAAAFLQANGIAYAGYVVAILALMEAPAILSGLYIAHRGDPRTRTHDAEEKRLAREIFTNGAILLLFGSFLIGWATGKPGMDKVEGFLVEPFHGILALFLLDMGLLVARNLTNLRQFTLPLALFGIYMPLIGALAGLFIARAVGLDAGTGMLFTVLCASASYIAVPAAMRLALPEARAEIYVPMSLGISFPFNVMVGIPLYFALAQTWLGG